MIGAGADIKNKFYINIKLTQFMIIKKKKNSLVAIGPQRASFLKVQNLLMSSKCNPDGHLFRYGYPSTHC